MQFQPVKIIFTSSVALQELSKVNNPDYVIMMSSGLSWLGLRDYKFITERLHYCSGGTEVEIHG